MDKFESGATEENTNYAEQLARTRQYWDREAPMFDHEPDHGLREPRVRQAWADLLTRWLPAVPTAVLDVGCGTGSLSLLLAEQGHQVTGIDLSQAMIAQAKKKALAAGQTVRFQVMDAYRPELGEARFDVIVCRHLLWALPSVAQALSAWQKLLQPHGLMLLVEGFWHTGAGLSAETLQQTLPSDVSLVQLESLSDRDLLWGGPVDDERYLAVLTIS